MEIMSGRVHFNELLGVIPNANPKTLSTRLYDLQRSGLIRRIDESHSGSRQVRYVLTAKGESMRHLVREIVRFSMEWHPIKSSESIELSATR
jgi:DNA-binding HxlR family transcriptional regulator